MSLRVTQYGEAVLREKSRPVREFGASLKSLAEEMLATMHRSDGIGLAAPQVGLSTRFCVVDLGAAANDSGDAKLDGRLVPPSLLMPLFLANPVLDFPEPDASEVMEEGCLSIRGIRGDVSRPFRIFARFQDPEGAEHSLECEGLLARCIQHEVDHLDGILFIDRMERKDLRKLRGKLKRLATEAVE